MLLAAVLAQAIANPSPATPSASPSLPSSAPTASPSPRTTATLRYLPDDAPKLSFSDGLRRLIADAPNKFENDGSDNVETRSGKTAYFLNFAVEGLADCAITPMLFVSCTVYAGMDPTMARGAYDIVKRKLRAFAGRGVPINEEVTTSYGDDAAKTSFTITKATYSPNEHVNVLMEMAQSKTSGFVLFYVVPIMKL